MTQTVASILAQAFQLPAAERQELIDVLTRAESNENRFAAATGSDDAKQPVQLTNGETTLNGEIPPARIIGIGEPFNDRVREYQWLIKHRREYVGQWVALEGDQLIAHADNAKEVFEKAEVLGMDLPLVLLVEDPDVCYAGF